MKRSYPAPGNGFFISILFVLMFNTFSVAQVLNNAKGAYSLRRVVNTYGGAPLIKVRRTCDDAVKDIGQTVCGELDTTALKTFVVAANPLSSISSPSAAAYSLRRLSCAYAGNAIQVRRSSDNATQNIGFNSVGDLDTVALKAFTGSNSAFVSIWYDQSGNGRNALQSTASLQPRIVNAGVIERQGPMPAIRWLGIGYALNTAPFTAYTSAGCFNAVAKVNTNASTGYNATVNKCTANFPAPLDLYNATIVIGSGPSYTFHSMSQNFNASQNNAIWTYQASAAGSVNAWMNSSSICSGTVTYFGDAGTPLTIGSRMDILTGLEGWISEVITFAVIPSNTDRAFVEWTQGQYYSIPSAPALGTIPPGAPSGYINTFYDQSGGGRHAVQTTLANQPRIILVGVIEKNGTKTAMRFGGTSQNLTATLPVTTYPASISTIVNTSGSATNGAFVKLGGTISGSGGIGIGIGASGTNFDNSGTSLIGLKEFQVWCPSSPVVNYTSATSTVTLVQQNAAGGNTMTAALNGSNVPLASATNVPDGTTITGNLFIGGYVNGANRYPVVKESEVLVYNEALSTTQRTLIESNQSAYYNITISNNKYTAPTANTYRSYVSGIGRESATDTVAFNTTTSGMGFASGTTTSDFLRDNGDYVTAGTDCPSPGVSVLNLPGSVVQRWTNDWYVNKTDVGSNNGTIQVFFDYGDYGVIGLPGIASNYVLLSRSTPSGTFAIVTTSGVVVSGDRVVFTLNTSNLTTSTYYTIGTRNVALSPLPIELLSFDAEACDKEVCLSWSTATETNNDYFTVEKTKDGSAFEFVGEKDGAGNSTSVLNYSMTDHAPYAGTSYYRLKQTDYNGAFSYSDLVPVDFSSNPDFAFSVFPNPAAGENNISISFSTGKNEEILVVVYDINGKQSYSKVIITENDGENISAIDPSGKLSAGIYMIVATSKQSVYSKKLIVK